MKGLLLASLLLLGCPNTPPPKPEPPLGRPATCADVCEHLYKLGCAAAMDSSCLRICVAVEKSTVMAWNKECFMTATTCTQADECDGMR